MLLTANHAMHRFLSYWWKTVAEYYSVSSKLQIATSWYKYVHTSSIWLERGKIQLSRTGWIMPIEQVVASKMCFLSYAVPERKVCYPKWQCPGSALVTDFYMAQGLPHTKNGKYIKNHKYSGLSSAYFDLFLATSVHELFNILCRKIFKSQLISN